MEPIIAEWAQQAMISRKLLRLPGGQGQVDRLTTTWDRETKPSPYNERLTERLIEAIWSKQGVGKYDGDLLAVSRYREVGTGINLHCEPMRYREYVAADDILKTFPKRSPRLGLGVHLVLSRGDAIVCLRRRNMRLALPGGAVDVSDLRPDGRNAVVVAAQREVKEETGIDLRDIPICITGIYIGGYPTHLMMMLVADISSIESVDKLSITHVPDDPDLSNVELIQTEKLLAEIKSLPLVLRVALKSLNHFRGVEQASEIET